MLMGGQHQKPTTANRWQIQLPEINNAGTGPRASQSQ